MSYKPVPVWDSTAVFPVRAHALNPAIATPIIGFISGCSVASGLLLAARVF